jgi:hypothetical protein
VIANLFLLYNNKNRQNIDFKELCMLQRKIKEGVVVALPNDTFDTFNRHLVKLARQKGVPIKGHYITPCIAYPSMTPREVRHLEKNAICADGGEGRHRFLLSILKLAKKEKRPIRVIFNEVVCMVFPDDNADKTFSRWWKNKNKHMNRLINQAAKKQNLSRASIKEMTAEGGGYLLSELLK